MKHHLTVPCWHVHSHTDVVGTIDLYGLAIHRRRPTRIVVVCHHQERRLTALDLKLHRIGRRIYCPDLGGGGRASRLGPTLPRHHSSSAIVQRGSHNVVHNLCILDVRGPVCSHVV